jgi:hypothetical protein
MTKPGEWILQIGASGTLEWHVHMSSGWAIAHGTTDIRKSTNTAANETFVVKATHAAGIIKLFVCQLAEDFQCEMLAPEGIAQGMLPLQTGTADIMLGAASVLAPTFDPGLVLEVGLEVGVEVGLELGVEAGLELGVEVGVASLPTTTISTVRNGFVGALEEIQFNRISLENVSAFLFNEPGSGCTVLGLA